MAADIPPKPPRYFNDFASLVDSQTAEKLNRQLEDFERETSNQLLVVIYPSLPPDAALEDFTQDAFRAWKPGQQGRNNGAILFVFVKDRKMRIQTGYGLEGALPDAICKRIISDELAPRFKTGDFAGGLTAAVNAMIAASRGEYKGVGRTVAESQAPVPAWAGKYGGPDHLSSGSRHHRVVLVATGGSRNGLHEFRFQGIRGRLVGRRGRWRRGRRFLRWGSVADFRAVAVIAAAAVRVAAGDPMGDS